MPDLLGKLPDSLVFIRSEVDEDVAVETRQKAEAGARLVEKAMHSINEIH